MKTKVCTKCGEEKALERYHKDKSKKDGRVTRCKDCLYVYGKAYRESNKEKVFAKKKAYREVNKEKIAARKKAYYEANKEKITAKKKAYYEANKENLAPKKKEYREANKEKIAEYQKAYRKANKKQIAEHKIGWNKENKDRLNKRRNKRYAEDPIYRTMISLRTQTKRLGDYKNNKTIEIVGISAEEFWRRNGSPTEEDLRDLHIDHIVPLSWFDLEDEDHVTVSSHWTNFQYLTTEENLMKGNRYAGTPRAILGTKEEFDIEKHVQDMIEFINATK